LPGFITFFRANGLNPNDVLLESTLYQYKSVFILDPLPLQQDGVRAEDEATSDFLDEWLEKDYTALGYSVFRVPVMPIEDRLRFILRELNL
jgi:predicted ATPase